MNLSLSRCRGARCRVAQRSLASRAKIIYVPYLGDMEDDLQTLHHRAWDRRRTMASKTTSRSLQAIAKRGRTSCPCSGSSFSRSPSVRQFSVSSPRPDVPYENDKAERPRWSYTPERMKAPFPAKPKNPEMAWECNNDPQLLDQFYIRFLGRGGDTVLTEEIKWLAITHKSFDQGRRGFNDRLAFFGMF
jgi:large subunit ribosomal protein L15